MYALIRLMSPQHKKKFIKESRKCWLLYTCISSIIIGINFKIQNKTHTAEIIKKKNNTKIQNHQHMYNRSNDTMISSKRMDCIGARLNNMKDKMCNWMGAGTVFPT